ncbi:MAG TPA: HlyD family efflux transporter periplasmic adaptor subunit [Vicinamibacteria bacterium]|nr:HlyD family efflux transporter periplasmic adaptor subunit [Vicinamibacteria bacterium]
MSISFRKQAMDKASSPEQLDLVMQVTSPMGWLALATIGAVLFVVGIWSVVGTIPDLVEGQGVLIRGERLSEIKAPVPGTIARINLAPDMTVEAGQVIAVINRDRSEIERKIALKQGELDRLRSQHMSENSSDEMAYSRNRALIGAKAAEIDSLRRQRATQQDLVNRGLKPENALFEFDRRITAARGELAALENENAAIQGRMAPRLNMQKSIEGEIEYLKGDLAQMATEIKSPEAGRVVEVIKSVSDKVGEGEPLVRLEAARPTGENANLGFCGGNIHAVIYVPGTQAGKVRPKQLARVSPVDVKKEEYGYIMGTVEWVSNFAASTDDMKEKLKNDRLVQSYAEKGPVYEARVCLTFDPENKVNGLKWSSSTGPPKKIDSGAQCQSSVVVDHRKPYTYVIPSIKRTLGV